jgi:hypothetical protein
MDREKKNRSGGLSNHGGKNENAADRWKDSQPGAPASSKRQSKGHDESFAIKETGTKKGRNSV